MDHEAILKEKYPAKAHCRRVVEHIRASKPDATGIIYLEGQKTRLIEDNDEPVPFRQRRPFYYLSGVPHADCVVVHELATAQTTLFIPALEPASVMWSGLPLTADEARARYDVDAVLTTPEINDFLAARAAADDRSRRCVFAYPGNVGDATTTFRPFDHVDWVRLRPAVEQCRVRKDDYEVALIRRANVITAHAHHRVMRRAAAGVRNERELEALFVGECMTRGGRNMAYHPIVASGRAAATLHYLRNDAPTEGKLNLLLDAGCEIDCYAADVTRTCPLGSTFTAESLAIYKIVLAMQAHSLSLLRADVLWEDVHRAAHRVAIDGLLAIGLLRGDRDAIFERRTSVAFFPHGLGHHLGLDVHDTGGQPNYEDPDPMFAYLRIRGRVPERAVVTVEPGIYFCAFIIEPYLKDPAHREFIDEDVLQRYWDVGGVRIEDNVLITKDGHENLTSAVKEVDDILREGKTSDVAAQA